MSSMLPEYFAHFLAENKDITFAFGMLADRVQLHKAYPFLSTKTVLILWPCP